MAQPSPPPCLAGDRSSQSGWVRSDGTKIRVIRNGCDELAANGRRDVALDRQQSRGLDPVGPDYAYRAWFVRAVTGK